MRALAIVATAAFVAVIALPACAGRTSRCFALLDAFPGYVESREQWLVDDSAVTYTLDCRPGRDRAWISVSEATTKTFPNVGREIVPGRVYELRWRSNGALDVAPSAWPEDAVLRDARVVRRGDRLRLAPIIE